MTTGREVNALAKLEALLAKATPGKWGFGSSRRCEGLVIGSNEALEHIAENLSPHDASFIVRAREAMPELLRIVKAMAAMAPCIDSDEEGYGHCPACEQPGHRSGAQAIRHKPECEWLAARKLAGEP